MMENVPGILPGRKKDIDKGEMKQWHRYHLTTKMPALQSMK